MHLPDAFIAFALQSALPAAVDPERIAHARNADAQPAMNAQTALDAHLVAFAASLETAFQADAGRLTPAARLALRVIAASAKNLAGLVSPAFFAAVASELAEPAFGSLGLADVLRGLADIDAVLAAIQGRRAGELAS